MKEHRYEEKPSSRSIPETAFGFPESAHGPTIPGACKRIPEAASFYDIPRHGEANEMTRVSSPAIQLRVCRELSGA
jgi:hypothetical protein